MIGKVIVIMLLVLSGCRQRSAEEKLRVFMEDPDNKIIQRITVGDVKVVTKFLPVSYRSLMEKRGSIGNGEDQFYYFDIKFNKRMTERPSKEKLLYLNFDMQKDFVLLANNRDSVAPAICQKIENGIEGDHEYIVAFEKVGNTKWKDFTLVYNDKIFSIGTVAFVYNEKDISKIPDIKGSELK